MLVLRPLCMWSPLIEAGSGNLALLHCSCLHACLAAYSNILRRDLNTMCITVNRDNTWRLLKQAFSKSRDKNHWEVASTCEVLWSARLNWLRIDWKQELTGWLRIYIRKGTANWQEDRSCQWEATKKSVGPSTARVVITHRGRYQWRWTATVGHLICVNIRRMGLGGKYLTVIDIGTPC